MEVNKTDREGRTALHHASSNSRVEVVRRLLGHQDLSSIETKTEAGETPIMMAVELGDMDSARELLTLPDMDTVSRVTEWPVLDELAVRGGHLKEWLQLQQELKETYNERLQESTRRLREKSNQNVQILKRMEKEKTTLINRIFYGDQKCQNSNPGLCLEKGTNKILTRLEKKVMRRETETKIKTVKEKDTKGKDILDNARIDQILNSLEPSTSSKHSEKKKKPKKSKVVHKAKNKEALPKHLVENETPDKVMHLASNNNDIKEDCSLSVVNTSKEVSGNQLLHVKYEEKLALLDMQKDYANSVVGSKAKEMASLITEMDIVENQMLTMSTEIANLEVRKAQLTSKYSEKDDNFNKLKQKREELEQFISTSLTDTKLNIFTLEKEVKSLEVKLFNENKHSNVTKEHIFSLGNLYIDSMNVKIVAKEKELECPVCLETASAPILMCEDQHLICNSCR